MTHEKTGQTTPVIGALSKRTEIHLALPGVRVVAPVGGTEKGKNLDPGSVPSVTGDGSGNIGSVKTNFIGGVGRERGRSGHAHVG